ncbi:hypothetical protein [Pectinatus frisingensis]|uniref:hypothetical protein n=1 Tax=Pectinatus frisingensis TaxID=865 RepID=UPI0018C77ABB|nr:hypothetical protein [Pectinatus frisingensis]
MANKADISVNVCFVCGADCSSVVRTDGSVWYCPVCGAPYGGAIQNSSPNQTTTDSSTDVVNSIQG